MGINHSFTWRGKDLAALPTQAQMVASQIALAEECARRASAARALYQRYGATPEGDMARQQMEQAEAEQRGFRRAAAFHREQHLLEQRQALAAEARRAEEERRISAGLPLVDREVGADDGDDFEEERESPWADIGGAVAAGGR